jgi:phospholipid/cholesterol/gamma-HCH transport system substrate-binding protein
VLLAGVITVAVIGLFIWLAEESYNGLPFVSYRTVYASLPNIGHLQVHDPVDIAGVRVGQVLRTSTRSNRALVELQLQGVEPLPADSQVIIRANGLLGSRYVELEPGRSSTMLPNGATVTGGNGSYYGGVPETLNLFDPKTRTALGNMINGVGTGMIGRGTELNNAIHVGPPSGANFNVAANAILAHQAAAAAFLPSADSGMTALSSARSDITEVLHPADVTLSQVVTDRSAVQQAISTLPVWEEAVDGGLAGPATTLLNAAEKLGRAADTVLPLAPTALRSATALLDRAGAPLRRTKLAFDAIPGAVPAALNILNALKPDLTPLREGFKSLVDPVTQLSMHGCDIQGFATSTASVVNWGTSPGGSWGPNVGFPLTVLIGPQEANNFLNTGITYPTEDAYPAPCAYLPGPAMSPLQPLPQVSLP